MDNHKPKCPRDNKHKVKLNWEYDAYYCVDCNMWLEEKCSEWECWACHNRPEYPSMCEEFEG